jgi:hypothetical protein
VEALAHGGDLGSASQHGRDCPVHIDDDLLRAEAAVTGVEAGHQIVGVEGPVA